MRWMATIAAILMAGTGAAWAADIGEAGRGREIARHWCAECHDITGALPRVLDGPPSFVSVANKPETTATGLRAFLHTPHAQMPDLALSREETDHMIAYILSLKRR